MAENKSLNQLNQEIKDFFDKNCSKYSGWYFTILNQIDIKIIHDLFVYNKIPAQDCTTTNCSSDVLTYLGIYYSGSDNYYYQKAANYYQMAIELGNQYAMLYFCRMHSTIDLIDTATEKTIIRYLKMAADLGNADAMSDLAEFSKPKDRLKYLLMAYEKGNTRCASNIAIEYHCIGQFELSKKYSIICMKNDAVIDIFWVNRFLEYYQHKEHKLDDYFFEFLEISGKFSDLLPPAIRLLAKIYNEGIEAIDLHIKYSPDGEGAKKAKKEFINRINQMSQTAQEKK